MGLGKVGAAAGRDRQRDEAYETRVHGEGKEKRRARSSGCNFGGGGGFPGRPGSRKEFMKGKSFPPTDRARLAARCAVEVPLMLRYFTGKLFKSNILPAVIKYKLHRASWAGRGEGRGGGERCAAAKV